MQLLAISDEGFLKCNGESMFVPLCPSGTVWNDLSKAFFWSDMQGVVGTSFADQSQQHVFFHFLFSYHNCNFICLLITGYGQQSYCEQRPLIR
jgi:hypothetical protein